MLESTQGPDDLYAAVSGERVFIRVSGRGSFKISATLKQFITDRCAKQTVSSVIVDLANCIGMDSTFMGVLAGLTGRLKKTGQSLELINLSDKNIQLLATLGVDQVVQYFSDDHGYEDPESAHEKLETAGATKKDLAETALQAHESLVELNRDNRPRFKRVIEYLKIDVDRLN